MAIEVTLRDIQSGFLTASAFNSNNTLIEQALAKALDRTGSTDNAMEVDLDMGLNAIFNVKTNLEDPTSLMTLEDADARYINYDGDVMHGDLNMNNFRITNLGIPLAPNDAARLSDVGPDSAANLRIELASNTSTKGSDLVAYTGTGETVTEALGTVTEALGNRTIFVSDRTEMKALTAVVGTNVYLTEDGRAGDFVIKSGTPPSDPQEGVYVVMSNGNYAERTVSGNYSAFWFGADGAGGTTDESAIASGIALCIIQRAKLDVDFDATIKVPSMASDMQEALDTVTSSSATSRPSYTLSIEAGHNPEVGLLLVGGDYSNWTINSVDRPCVVSASLTSSLFKFQNCRSPILNTLFDMVNVTTVVTGYEAIEGSLCKITPTNGIIFSPGSGLYAENSIVEAQGCNFNNSSNVLATDGSCIAAWEGAIINADGGSAQSGWVGVNAGFGGTINFMAGTAINNTRHNIRARENGRINCQDAVCTGAGAYNIYAWKSSNINARGVNAQNAGEIAINAVEGSVVAARDAITDGSPIGLKALQSSTIDAPFSSNDNCTDTAVYAEAASTINVESGTGTNATTRSVIATGRSNINCTLFNGNGGVEIRADAQSSIAARGATTPSFRVETGSTMAISTFTSTNITPNTLDPKGIIFQS